MTITTSAPVLAAALHRLIVARVEFAPLKDQRGMGSVYSRSRDQDRVLEPGLVESGSRRLEQGEPFLLEEVVGLPMEPHTTGAMPALASLTTWDLNVTRSASQQRPPRRVTHPVPRSRP